MVKREFIVSPREQNEVIEGFVAKKAVGESKLKILEAGCGRRWPLRLDKIRFELTGVDLDEEALDARKKQFNDLDKLIIGDLCNIELDEDYYDVIYTSFVLEHIKGVEVVLDNFSKWLNEDGIMVIKVPDRDTAFGFLTRMTPFWLHVFYKRFVRGVKNAGKPGFGPYPTFYDPVLSRKQFYTYCGNNDLEVEREFCTDGFSRLGLKRFPIKLIMYLVHLLSFGILAWKHNNVIYIVRKKAVIEKKPSRGCAGDDE